MRPGHLLCITRPLVRRFITFTVLAGCCVAAAPVFALPAPKPVVRVLKAKFVYRDVSGTEDSAEIVTNYQPDKIVHPVAKLDRRVNAGLLRAATIAQERAHAHSRSRCWHYVKEALLAAGVLDSRPKSELAKEAADDLVRNYGFRKLAVRDPYAAPVGAVLVYGARRAAGHVELRTKTGFVSDFLSKTPSRRPLLGIYAKS